MINATVFEAYWSRGSSFDTRPRRYQPASCPMKFWLGHYWRLYYSRNKKREVVHLSSFFVWEPGHLTLGLFWPDSYSPWLDLPLPLDALLH